MIALSHNVGDVLQRLKAKRGELVAKRAAAMAPRYYRMMRELAKLTLESEMTPDEIQYLPAILSQIREVAAPGRLTFSMNGIPIDKLIESTGKADVFVPHPSILEWVATMKERDQRDAGKSDEQIALHIAGALTDPETAKKFYATDVEGHGLLNPTGLVRSTGLVGIDSDRLTYLYARVLHNWKLFMRENIQSVMGSERDPF